ncbi:MULTISPECIES: hypothetical protein [unclassified Pseudomonas]|uniref:hypothetical protein n=1 Tax=unclassified Pseudomonas TaxID=196821 RepID=UPI001199D5AD|nr:MULTISPECIES: hypothetical protein [unclassified Pseudomonas]TWC20399.1 hypothetical protein FBY00_10424 [Pseudomonas sp. SJZ075]TWC25722.1 hypothetical protein FBX99_101261 [Pseudomonas sp. SJZ074]TWC35829.1 hypothetical protein FBY02_10425 [Pseudomonas sp. SJZ078]TWC42533.1 hypothetical protein FBY06_101261 [Pseudomonas sp. SJZ085]TWC56697.1 hypothetical protein FBY11_10424 [Pseudomonas sp. SJZ124]
MRLGGMPCQIKRPANKIKELPSIPKELVEQFVNGPMTVESILVVLALLVLSTVLFYIFKLRPRADQQGAVLPVL